MRKTWSKPASGWFISLIALISLSGCGIGDDLASETVRNQIIRETENALTNFECDVALEKIKPLYGSKYSNNEIRMLYASAQGCKAGIRFYSMLQSITGATWGSPDAVFKSLVEIFPSTTSDSRLASSWYAIDILQTIIKPGSVIAPADAVGDTFNPGSILAQDRSDDANMYLVFLSMSSVGTSLNRFGFNPTDDPAALAYAQQVDLAWTTKAAVLADTTGSACALASGLYNMFDAIDATGGILSGSIGTTLSAIAATLQGAIDAAADAQCTSPNPVGDNYSQVECDAAKARIRARSACSEQDAAASIAAGVMKAINAGWL